MFAIMLETEGHGREFGRRQKMRSKCAVEVVCKYCQRRFTKPYNLMIHERSHKDDVTFTCEVCGKSFKRQDNLKQHRDTHIRDVGGYRHVSCGNIAATDRESDVAV
ncbi:protein drumstick [Lasius niger]|uniref:Protein drumstick n=1 Tax=Lasius niger TaxID=67767 RepID=A0A0J7K7P6_LASNI|nr:protein drumstick [Lasius niger]